MALVAADDFEGNASELAEKALKADPKLYEAQELLARVALEDNNPEKADEEAKKALEISGEALDAMAILATIDWLDDKTGHAVDRQRSSKSIRLRRGLRDRGSFLRHQPPLRRRDRVLSQGAGARAGPVERAQPNWA